MKIHHAVTLGVVGAVLLIGGFWTGYQYSDQSNKPLRAPFLGSVETPELPLLAYTFPALRQRIYPARTITLGPELRKEAD
ncbi:hypothetical protein KA082_03065, partial [Candidatus Woesebacteria bacterium]|nr:hypothetical protein [Candidatus Woesebacteria bacterium]